MTIELQPIPTGTQVVAQTKSQLFIFGDVLDYYNRYLSDFFTDVKAVLQRERNASASVSSKLNATICGDNPYAPPEHL
jgi:hypothetical protein